MKSLYSYLFENKYLVFGITLLVLLASILAQLTPFIQGLIVDKAILSSDYNSLINILVIFISVLALDVVSRAILSISMTNYGYSIASKVRKNIFAKTLNRPLDFFEKNYNGDILQRTNFYVYNIGSYISSTISNFAIGIIRFVIIFAFMFVLNYKFALCLSVIYLVAFLAILLCSKKLLRLGASLKKCELHRNSLILENIDGMETYLAYNDNFDYLNNYKQINSEYGKIRTKYYFLYNSFNPLIDFIVGLGTVVIYHITFNVGLGLIDVGVVVAMLAYANRILEPIQLITSGIASMSETKSVIDKVFALSSEDNCENLLKIKYDKINVRCENICYENSPNATHIKNLNLEIPFGQKLLVVGKYGLGKTSFANLLTGLYKTDKGKIYFNEIDINTICKSNLNEMVSLASDEVGIFSGTIFQNIRFALPTATEQEIKSAIKNSGLLPWVNSLKKKEKTLISEDSVSEGDKQLIAFARVILKNTPIVIFDEFARDLSSKIKKQFFKNLKKFAEGKTLIYISQNSDIDFKFDKKVQFQKINND